MSTPNNTDILLVERSGTQYKISIADMSTVNDTDLFLVERSGTQYKIEAQDLPLISGYLDTPAVVTPVNGSGLNAGTSYTPQSSAIVSESNGVITFYDNTELANIVGPVAMVASNGSVKTPQTATIAGKVHVPGNWNQYQASGSGYNANPWNCMAYGNSKYVCLSRAGNAYISAYSSNGTSWQTGNAITYSSYNDVHFANGMFVGVGSNNVYNRPQDGNSWPNASISGGQASRTFRGVTYGNGTWVAVAENGLGYSGTTSNQVMTSTDGINWTNRQASSYSTWNDVAYGNNLFVAIAGGGSIRTMTSSNGISWTNGTITTVGWSSITYGNGKFVAVSYSSPYVAYSSNGTSWTTASNVPAGWWRRVRFGNGLFVAVSDNATNKIMYSADGINWTNSAYPSGTGGYVGVAYGANGWVACSKAYISGSANNFRFAHSVTGQNTYYTYTFSADTDLQFLKAGDTVTSGGTSGTVISDGVPATKSMNVSSSYSTGATITGPALNTTASNVSSQSGNTLTVSSVSGDFRAGLFVKGATVTQTAPARSSITFTSSNGGTTPVTGLDATLARRIWTLETSNSSSGPWTLVGNYTDNAANSGQNGATAWSNPTLSANTFYRIKVTYESTNAAAVVSGYNTFKTGA